MQAIDMFITFNFCSIFDSRGRSHEYPQLLEMKTDELVFVPDHTFNKRGWEPSCSSCWNPCPNYDTALFYPTLCIWYLCIWYVFAYDILTQRDWFIIKQSKSLSFRILCIWYIFAYDILIHRDWLVLKQSRSLPFRILVLLSDWVSAPVWMWFVPAKTQAKL